MKERNDEYISPDGEVCERIIVSPSMGYVGRSEKDREGFELDADYYKKQNPKYVKYRDGHREFYNSTKHR